MTSNVTTKVGSVGILGPRAVANIAFMDAFENRTTGVTDKAGFTRELRINVCIPESSFSGDIF